ncbi:exodeoxyribonuclease III [Rhodospirillum sp. A1_3_36]|uniref:exodeoxyribonuclease III n=1 Tax=Rhodospirillum sp. A1_3_36 TaxID=3391666 RepID=UPI0039A44A60
MTAPFAGSGTDGLTVASWNVNSLRLRLPQVARLMEERPIDVLCVQEIKAAPDKVPLMEMAALGFPYHAVHSMPGYNGVGIFSRHPVEGQETLDWCGKGDCRHIRARVAGIDIHCLYVPAGGDLPDPEENPKFRHKLDFIDALTEWSAQAIDPDVPTVMTGDFNVAPLETDVWDHKKMRRIITHTPIEREKLEAFQNSGSWVDAMRRFVSPEEKLFTWWSYRARDWKAANRGRRLDHFWVTPVLACRLSGMEVFDAARAWEKPSDHAPVIVRLSP